MKAIKFFALLAVAAVGTVIDGAMDGVAVVGEDISFLGIDLGGAQQRKSSKYSYE